MKQGTKENGQLLQTCAGKNTGGCAGKNSGGSGLEEVTTVIYSAVEETVQKGASLVLPFLNRLIHAVASIHSEERVTCPGRPPLWSDRLVAVEEITFEEQHAMLLKKLLLKNNMQRGILIP